MIVAWSHDETLKTQITAQVDAKIIWNLPLRGVVKTVADLRPLVAIIDLHGEDWVDIVRALKSNPATRRLTVIGFTFNLTSKLVERAGQVLVDEIIENDELITALTNRILLDLPRTELQTSLAAAAHQPLPALAQQGIHAFNARNYYEAHELLEHAWMAETKAIRDMYRGILQVAVAYYQIQKGNYWGALKMFLRSLQWLEPLPEICQGVDIAQLREDAHIARQTLEQLGPDGMADFDLLLLKPIRIQHD